MTEHDTAMRITDAGYSDIKQLDDDTKLGYTEELLKSIKDYPKEHYEINEEKLGKGWGHSLMHVLRDDEEVFSYERDYPSFGKSTCKVFHQYDFVDHAWRSYLLFSKDYVRASVLNLDNGDECDESYPIYHGKEEPSISFCPMEFKTFPIVDDYDGSDKDIASWMEMCHERLDFCNDILSFSGVFALESGCIWGDDSSSKLRHVDLSRIRDGVLKCDERYGYFELLGGLENVEYDDGIVYAPRLTRLSVDEYLEENEE